MAQLMLLVVGTSAEFERSLIQKRQRGGIALAKTAGKYKARKKSLLSEQVQGARTRIEEGAGRA